MSLIRFTKAAPCLVCGGWAWSGSSGEQCVGGVFEQDRTVLYCSTTPNDFSSSSGKTWRYRLDRPYEFEPDKRSSSPSKRSSYVASWPHGVPQSWTWAKTYIYKGRDEGEDFECFRVARFEAPAGASDSKDRAKEFRPLWRVSKPRSRMYNWGYPSGPRLPYKLPELLDAIAAGFPVFVVEGEKDVETGYAETTEVAFTCNPGGARAWKSEHGYARWFEGARRVMIVADRDPNGSGHAWARDVRDDLAPVVSVLQVVQARVDLPGADLTDHLSAGFTLEDLEPIDL